MDARTKFIGYFKMRTGNGEWRIEKGERENEKTKPKHFKIEF